jgi:hypothetical protein
MFGVGWIDFVALHPSSEEFFRNVILLGARAHAITAADAFVDVYGHAPPVIGGAIGFGGSLGRFSKGIEAQCGGGEHQQLTSGTAKHFPRVTS